MGDIGKTDVGREPADALWRSEEKKILEAKKGGSEKPVSQNRAGRGSKGQRKGEGQKRRIGGGAGNRVSR